MKYVVYNTEGNEVEKIDLSKSVFEVEMNNDLVHQVLVSAMSNKRQGTAHAKDRSEVSGGGRKPWRQKGTGRARHGSRRSPIWIGGGVTFGPRNEKNYKKDIPKKMKRKALLMALSEKAKNNSILILDKLDVTEDKAPKTKIMNSIIKNLPMRTASKLVLHNNKKEVFLSARNIQKTGVLEVKNLNILDLLNYKYLLMDKEGLKEIEKTFSAKK